MSELLNKRLEQIFETVQKQAGVVMAARSQDIEKAWMETIEEAQENQEKFPDLKLTFAVVVNLEKEKVETALRFTCAYCSKISETLPDPNQPDLPLGGKEGK